MMAYMWDGVYLWLNIHCLSLLLPPLSMLIASCGFALIISDLYSLLGVQSNLCIVQVPCQAEEAFGHPRSLTLVR